MVSWKLENAIELQKEAPYTFYRPSDTIINQLKPGEATVKLIFQFESDELNAPAAERMWVILDKINEDGSFTGTLDNDPFHIKDLKAGDNVTFGREHIIQYDVLDDSAIEDADRIPLEPFFKRCLVSNQVMHHNETIGYIYREEPDGENDSGWRIMSGMETDEYAEDHENFQYIAIGVVLNKDDSFINLLNHPTGSEFVRDKEIGEFFSVH